MKTFKTRYFKEKYKTIEGAKKRLSFERATHPSELRNFQVPHALTFGIEEQSDGMFRVTKTRV